MRYLLAITTLLLLAAPVAAQEVCADSTSIIATGGAPHIVLYPDGSTYSTHSTESAAHRAAVNLSARLGEQVLVTRVAAWRVCSPGAGAVTPPPVDTGSPPPPPPVDTVTPPPPPPAVDGFPNLPAGIPVRTHVRWVGGTPAGWNITPRRGTPRIVADPTSPTGGALEFQYPAGHPDGHEVGVVWTGGPGAGADEMFLGVVMRYSANWTSHNNEVKLHLWAGEGTWFGIFDGCWNNRVPQWKIASRALNPVPRPTTENCWTNNVAASPTYTPGEWVTQELYVRRSTGTVMLWVNGRLLAEHHNVGPVRTMSFVEFQHAGTWGGGGGNVLQAQTWSVAETLIAWR